MSVSRVAGLPHFGQVITLGAPQRGLWWARLRALFCARRGIYSAFTRRVKDGVSERELEETKKAYLAEQKQQRSSDDALAQLLQNELEAGRKLAYLVGQEKQIAALRVEEVNSAIRRHFDPKKLVIVRAGDLHKKGETKR